MVQELYKEGKYRIYYDPAADSLIAWWGDPETEKSCTETEDKIVVMRDAEARPIGIEILRFSSRKKTKR